jgi:hypothetical protein
VQQEAEVQQNDDRDESPEHEKEFPLRHKVRLAGLVDELGDFTHCAMNRQLLELHVNRQPKQQSEHAK